MVTMMALTEITSSLRMNFYTIFDVPNPKHQFLAPTATETAAVEAATEIRKVTNLYCNKKPTTKRAYCVRRTYSNMRTSSSCNGGQGPSLNPPPPKAFEVSLRSSSALESLKWANESLRYLPVEERRADDDLNTAPHNVANAIYTRVKPSPLLNPRLVAHSPDALRLVGLNPELLSETELADVFSGNHLIAGSDPSSHCYCGHQFGVFAGQLGDGAAILLGEVKRPSAGTVGTTGEPGLAGAVSAAEGAETVDLGGWSLQLKGSGLTPFSRSADGRKVLRSSIREFLCSECIDALGIPTTRAACIVTSDSRVYRDIFYTGNPVAERCSVVLRIAKTFIRFGSFEIFKHRDPNSGRAGPSAGNRNLLTGLANFCIFTLYPHLVPAGTDAAAHLFSCHQQPDHSSSGTCSSSNKQSRHTSVSVALPAIRSLDKQIYRDWFIEIVERTARLVARWQCVGFCHGVLNTDNMSIIGDTIDYGPYGFMEIYNPHFICNSSDKSGRYTYKQQPSVCRWNCGKLYEALNPLLQYHSDDEIEEVFRVHYDGVFETEYLDIMRRKLGLVNSKLMNEDKDLIRNLLHMMRCTAADFTTTFKILEKISLIAISGANSTTTTTTADAAAAAEFPKIEMCSQSIKEAVDEFLSSSVASKEQLQRSMSDSAFGPGTQLGAVVSSLMGKSRSIPFYLAVGLGIDDNAIEVWEDQMEFAAEMKPVLQNVECKVEHDKRLFSKWLNEYTARVITDAKADVDVESYNVRRKRTMKAENPVVVLRNHLAQRAIEEAENNNFSETRRLLSVLRRPFESCQKAEDTKRGSDSIIVT